MVLNVSNQDEMVPNCNHQTRIPPNINGNVIFHPAEVSNDHKLARSRSVTTSSKNGKQYNNYSVCHSDAVNDIQHGNAVNPVTQVNHPNLVNNCCKLNQFNEVALFRQQSRQKPEKNQDFFRKLSKLRRQPSKRNKQLLNAKSNSYQFCNDHTSITIPQTGESDVNNVTSLLPIEGDNKNTCHRSRTFSNNYQQQVQPQFENHTHLYDCCRYYCPKVSWKVAMKLEHKQIIEG